MEKNHKYKPGNRNYKCSKCSFEYHRDEIGAINIFKKYTVGKLTSDKSNWLEGDLTPPIGVRYSSQQCYLADWNTSIFDTGFSNESLAKEAA